ncbi:MAG: hypothetical protein HKN32_04815, partial [Flavobacteriales bacterium]|nr:hypothetical protein [Flavobacteriales bacterium]
TGLPHHEWLVEGENLNFSSEILEALDLSMQEQNPYYKDLIQGNVLRQLEVTPLKAGTFNAFMKSIGKLGGQNKVPRLANDRKVAEGLISSQ